MWAPIWAQRSASVTRFPSQTVLQPTSVPRRDSQRRLPPAAHSPGEEIRQVEIAAIAPHAIRRTALPIGARKKPIGIPDDARCALLRFTTSADSIALGKTLKESTFRV
jgi:hypothetical protein